MLPRLCWVGAPILLLTMACTASSNRIPPSSSGGVEAEGVQGVVVQPWERHQSWTETRWAQAFQYLQDLDVEQVLVQWSRWHERRYYAPSYGRSDTTRSVLAHVLRQAERHGMEVWVGLASDSAWWSEQFGADLTTTRVKLAQIRRRNRATARRLAPLLTNRSVFAGWYLPEEIDDRRWQSDHARELLRHHLRRSVAMLDSAFGTHPVAVSGYPTGQRSPRAGEQFWRRVLANTGIDRFFFQDGIGAGHLDLGRLRPYLAAVADATHGAGVDLRVIVEPFERQAPTSASSDPRQVHNSLFQPTSWDRLRRQLSIVREVEVSGSYLFAALQYMTPFGSPEAVELYNRYRAAIRDTPTADAERPPVGGKARLIPAVRKGRWQ